MLHKTKIINLFILKQLKSSYCMNRWCLYLSLFSKHIIELGIEQTVNKHLLNKWVNQWKNESSYVEIRFFLKLIILNHMYNKTRKTNLPDLLTYKLLPKDGLWTLIFRKIIQIHFLSLVLGAIVCWILELKCVSCHVMGQWGGHVTSGRAGWMSWNLA